ncbi:hypothetical protein VPH219E481_0069 [Vibrio phage 219E48-1]
MFGICRKDYMHTRERSRKNNSNVNLDFTPMID